MMLKEDFLRPTAAEKMIRCEDINDCDNIHRKMYSKQYVHNPLQAFAPKSFMAIIIVLVACGVWQPTSALAPCPTSCNCNDDTLVVQCEEGKLDVLPIALNPSIQRLIIRNNKIKTIDSSIQFYAELQHLDLSQNHLVNIPPKSFENQKKLQELHLYHNKISNVTNKTFLGLVSLTVLNLRLNFLEELNEKTLSTLPRLEELNLGQNRISRIDPSAFIGLTALRVLYLDDNQLSSVPTPAFASLGSLAELHVGLNTFTWLPDDAFAGLNRLSNLDLNNAGLSNISANAFRGLPGLRNLNLSGNRLKDVPSEQLSTLIRLEELQIGQNDFEVIVNKAFRGLKNLRRLDATGSTALLHVEKGAFDENPNLETIILASNKKLSSVEEGAFIGLPKLKHLVLRDDGFKTLGEGVFAAEELKKLELTDNPLHCDCSLLWLRAVLERKHNLTTALCAGPPHLKDKPLAMLSADDLGCPLQDPAKQTLVCVAVAIAVALIAAIALALYRYRKSVREKLEDYTWNKRAMTRKEHEYRKTFSEDDYVVRGIHPASAPPRPIPVTEL